MEHTVVVQNISLVYHIMEQGQDNAWTEISVASDAPANLYYYCKNHSGMGGVINITG